jgi:glycerol kinase
MAYVVAIDQGTTGSTVLVLDSAGASSGAPQRVHAALPSPAGSDDQEIWRAARACARGCARRAPGDGRRGDRCTNQRETTVVWDPAGKPIHRAIVWQDRCTAALWTRSRPRGRRACAPRPIVLDPFLGDEDPLASTTRARAGAAAGGLPWHDHSWLVWKPPARRARDRPDNVADALLRHS